MNNLEYFIKITIAILIIIIVARILGTLITYVGQPRVVGEMISGVILGPTCFGYFFPDLSAEVFAKPIMPGLFVLSNLGLSIYMFLVGAEIDLKLFNKKAVRDASILSVAALVVPFILGAVAALMYNDTINSKHIDATSMTIFLGTALAITAFPMLARILQERKIINTRIGVLSLISASIQDVVSWILLGLVTAMATTQNYSDVVIMLIGALALLMVLFFIVRPLLLPVAKKVKNDNDLSQNAFSVIVVLLVSCALITDKLGLYSVFGGFILGISLPREGKYIEAISARLKDFTVVLLLPIFFTFSGLNTNMLTLAELDMMVPTLVLVLFAFISKYFSCMFAMRAFSGFTWRESSAIGGLINARGLMELIIATIGLEHGLIDIRVYSILVLIAITSTLAALPIYNWSMGKPPKE